MGGRFPAPRPRTTRSLWGVPWNGYISLNQTLSSHLKTELPFKTLIYTVIVSFIFDFSSSVWLRDSLCCCLSTSTIICSFEQCWGDKTRCIQNGDTGSKASCWEGSGHWSMVRHTTRCYICFCSIKCKLNANITSVILNCGGKQLLSQITKSNNGL